MSTRSYQVRRSNAKTLTDVCVATKTSRALAEASIRRMHYVAPVGGDVRRYIKAV